MTNYTLADQIPKILGSLVEIVQVLSVSVVIPATPVRAVFQCDGGLSGPLRTTKDWQKQRESLHRMQTPPWDRCAVEALSAEKPTDQEVNPSTYSWFSVIHLATIASY